MTRRLLAVLILMVAVHWAVPARADIVQFGRHVTIDEGHAESDVVCIGCGITVRGSANDLVAIGGRVEVFGAGNGDIVAIGGNVHVGSNATVKGDVVAVGGRVENDPGGRIGGEVQSIGHLGPVGEFGAFGLLLLIVVPAAIFGFLIALVAFAVIREPRVQVIAATISQEAGMAFLVGLAAVAVFCGAAFIFAHAGHASGLLEITIAVVFAIVLVAGYTGLSYLIGGKISSGSGVARVLIGALIITVLQIIPVVNIVVFVFVLMALGGAVLSGLGSNPRPIATSGPPPMVAAR